MAVHKEPYYLGYVFVPLIFGGSLLEMPATVSIMDTEVVSSVDIGFYVGLYSAPYWSLCIRSISCGRIDRS